MIYKPLCYPLYLRSRYPSSLLTLLHEPCLRCLSKGLYCINLLVSSRNRRFISPICFCAWTSIANPCHSVHPYTSSFNHPFNPIFFPYPTSPPMSAFASHVLLPVSFHVFPPGTFRVSPPGSSRVFAPHDVHPVFYIKVYYVSVVLNCPLFVTIHGIYVPSLYLI